MKSIYKPIGDLVERIDERNINGSINTLLGVSIDKCFIKSVANTVGTDLTKYKVIRRDDFAVSLMQVSRDAKIPVACLKDCDCAIMSPAYSIFRVVDTNEVLPDYLSMWFSRSEFDREAAFIAVGGVRGSMPWEEFCRIQVLVPSLEEQRKIVRDYQTVVDRIALKRKINDNLEATIQTIYKSMFLNGGCQYVQKSLADICDKIGSGATPKGGKAAYCDKGITLIRSTNVVDYGFIYDGLAYITDEQADNLSNVIVNAGDVLFNITGVSVARCCMVPDDVLPARVNQHVMIIRPKMGKDMSYYIMATLCHSENKLKLLGIAQSGSTREAINKQEMEQFSIPVPSDAAIHEFGVKAGTLFSSISENTNEIRQLLDMQELLLSRLSSH